ncbi:23S rRNA (pseudouridine(1915)-N(3))-methyltransferase RlmH [Rhodovulum sp. DZ06]|uniref:23S rRNA (pseudouridine(1915)-N(3))-methyltransferase RlmH n=1 Tax=Rhodovulum sp. DZ06 TaxID=3425126 RepID=UPI003D32FAF4
MDLHILAVGRLRGGPEAELISDYLDRAGKTGRAHAIGPCAVIEVEDKKNRGRDAEAELLLGALPKDAALIALDERGKTLSSPQLADTLARYRDDGRRACCFAIGGADGHGKALLARADLKLSFGPMVWPHMLARAMIAEQMFRAASILAGTPYHRV